ncbi:SDR family NAD(P)-dependent oxidoreductase [Klebsiella pneumoniae]
MLKQGKGSIVNISSVATAGVNRVPYSAAKAALTR